MIAKFFQSLEAEAVDYLLISGQATVLYGAATFSEDIDLWVKSSRPNLERFRAVLVQAGARYYKLTPPLELHHLIDGFGFHFVLGNTGSEIFLDVLGRPPRTRAFAEAQRDSKTFATEWGCVPTMGLGDLIELKKTQRLADYPVISALTLRALETAGQTPELLGWALQNVFTAESFFFINEHYPHWTEVAPESLPNALKEFSGRAMLDIPDHIVKQAIDWMIHNMTRHQLADREYWRPIIARLRKLRGEGVLMPEGASVA